MKNLFLICAFLIGSGYLINAKNEIKTKLLDPYDDCNEEYFKVYNFLKGFTGDERYAFKVALAIEEECLEAANEEI